MKIRHKQSGVVLEGHYTTCTDALNMRRPRSYFMSTDYSRYSTDEWEAVAPEPVWRDVTAECFPLKGSNGESWTHSVKYVLGTMVDGYRLRKVRAFMNESRSNLLGMSYPSRAPIDAFIIERKEQP